MTGASGFIGSHFVRSMWSDGHVVAALIRGAKTQGETVLFDYDGSTHGVIDAMRRFRPEIVIHLASKYLVTHDPEDVEPLVESNILLGNQILEAMCKAGVPYLVNFGTSFQHYGGADYNPVSLYAATKQAFEDLARYYVEAHSLSVVTLKLSDTYGPDDRRGKIIALLEGSAARARPWAFLLVTSASTSSMSMM